MTKSEKIGEKLRDIGMKYPEAHEDFPWGERAIKVRGKAFIFMQWDEKQVSLSVKLPKSHDLALDTGFAEPTHYGLGKHGWVTITITSKAKIPLDVVTAWIDESYRAIAPKSLVKTLG
jgi:predicted DNA-binding protein (MmcQ/YjbR family)